MNYGQNWFIIPYWKGIGGKMIETELFERIYEAASIQRWNDHIRPSDGFTELDKQAHKLYYAYVLSRVENGIDRLRLIEGCIFEFLHRIILTDLKPPVFYKLMEQKGEQINTWVLSELEPTCKKIPGGFYERFRSYFLDPDYSKTEKIIIKASCDEMGIQYRLPYVKGPVPYRKDQKRDGRRAGGIFGCGQRQKDSVPGYLYQ